MQDNPNRLSSDDIAEAKRVSPAEFLKMHFSNVRVSRNGRNISVKGHFRSDYKPGLGLWLSCDWGGGPVGDNIQLVQSVTGGTFLDAIETLVGNLVTTPSARPEVDPPPAPDDNARPVIPSDARSPKQGMDYLTRTRGVSEAAVEFARRQGALRFITDGVVFLGRDWMNSREVRYAAVRYFKDRVLNRDGDIGNKKDLPHSSKSFPMMIGGEDNDVLLVEGGLNALALLDMMLALGRCPLVMTTGGVGITSYLETPHVRDVISNASQVIIYGENERAATEELRQKKQMATDENRKRVALRIAELRSGEPPRIVFPPEAYDDAASQNLARRISLGEIHPAEQPDIAEERASHLKM